MKIGASIEGYCQKDPGSFAGAEEDLVGTASRRQSRSFFHALPFSTTEDFQFIRIVEVKAPTIKVEAQSATLRIAIEKIGKGELWNVMPWSSGHWVALVVA